MNNINKNRLLVSFSGGETSAFMTYHLLYVWPHDYDEIAVVFANTGQENEATLNFVHECDKQLNFGSVWVEAETQFNQRKAPNAKIVTFETASRDGHPFEDMIKKHGVPNQAFPHCTRELKLAPIYSYLASAGWKKGTYDIAIGIRADEIDRMSVKAAKNRIIYPCIKYKITKPVINSWWKTMPFRLDLKGYQGNCKWCWKKSDRKVMTLMLENPEFFDFPARMEKNYGFIGPEFKLHADKLADDYRRVFFRKNRSTDNMRLMCEELPKEFKKAADDAVIYDPNWDVAGGCGESCEVFTDED